MHLEERPYSDCSSAVLRVSCGLGWGFGASQGHGAGTGGNYSPFPVKTASIGTLQASSKLSEIQTLASGWSGGGFLKIGGGGGGGTFLGSL